jgi:DNA-directed RNA polymerase specialized sigma24 family protein
MSEPPEITASLIAKFIEGDDESAGVIWESCHAELMRYAKTKLAGLSAKHELAEDVALSAIKSFMLRAREGKFPNLSDSSNVWKLLYKIASRKAWKTYQKNNPQRSGTTVEIEQVQATIDRLPQILDELLDSLADDHLRTIGELHLSGFNNREIAEQLGTYPESIRRSLILIKAKWRDVLDGE